MKHKGFMFVIIILFLCSYGVVGAKKDQTSLRTGKVTFAGKKTYKLEPYYSNSSDPQMYKYFVYTINIDGKDYPAYCLDPALGGGTGLDYTCSPMSPDSRMRPIYTLMKSINKYGLTDLGVNIAFRALGMAAMSVACEPGQAEDDCIVVDNTQSELEQAFIMSQQLYAEEIGLGFKGSEDKRGLNFLGTPEAKAGIKAAVEANISSAVDDSSVGGTPIVVTEAGATGSLVKLTPIDNDKKIGIQVRKYKIESVNGADIKGIKVAGTDGKVYANLENDWDGKQGTLTVIPSNLSDCSGIVTVTGDNGSGATGPDSTVYICSNSSSANQRFIVLGPGLAGDLFTFPELCKCDVNNVNWHAETQSCDDGGGGCPNCGGATATKVDTPIEIEIENCCGGHNSLSHEYLNNLFCRNNQLQVDMYDDKCDTEGYSELARENTTFKDGEGLCEIWCADSLEYGLPEPTEGMIGRGFELKLIELDPPFQNGGTTYTKINGPWMKEWVRCRVATNYKLYEDAIEPEIASEITNFNIFAPNNANYTYLQEVENKSRDKYIEAGYWYTYDPYIEIRKIYTDFVYKDENGNLLYDDSGNPLGCHSVERSIRYLENGELDLDEEGNVQYNDPINVPCGSRLYYQNKTITGGDYGGIFKKVKFYNATDNPVTIKGTTVEATNRKDFEYTKVKPHRKDYEYNEIVSEDMYHPVSYPKQIMYDKSSVSSYGSAPYYDLQERRNEIESTFKNESYFEDVDCNTAYPFRRQSWMQEYEEEHNVKISGWGDCHSELDDSYFYLSYRNAQYEENPYSSTFAGQKKVYMYYDEQLPYANAAASARNKLNNSIRTIRKLDENLSMCDNALRTANDINEIYSGNKNLWWSINSALGFNIDKLFDMKPEDVESKNDLPVLKFSYVQAYLDEDGNFQDQILEDMNYKRTCTIRYDTRGESLHGTADEKGIDGDRYSDIYKEGMLRTRTFQREVYIGHKEYLPGITEQTEQVYNADKVFVNDGLMEVYCIWDNQRSNDDPRYTLVPSGIIVGQDGYEYQDPNSTASIKLSTNSKYIVKHNGWRYMYSAAVAGTFETYFDFSKIGIVRDWNVDIASISESCSDKFLGPTCKFIYSIDFKDQGYCNDEVFSKEDKICEWYQDNKCDVTNKDVKEDDDGNLVCSGGARSYFDYKLVDPTNLFPNAYGDDAYAYNWRTDPNGVATKAKVERDGELDKTYSMKDNLSYSFHLSTGDLKAIKDYNKSELSNGGYMDFNMDCSSTGYSYETSKELDEEHIVMNNGKDSRNIFKGCKSKFLDAISGGTPLEYGNSDTKTLSINAGTSSMLSRARMTYGNNKVDWENR